MALSPMILGGVLFRAGLFIQVGVLRQPERQTALLTLVLPVPWAIRVAFQRRGCVWLGVMMVVGIALAWTGFALK